jgi:hypothetical protein
LKVAADLVDEPKPNFRVCAASANSKFVAAAGQADIVGLLEALAERPARDDHAPWFA